ncbi:MAG: hypothetical protein ACKO96_24520, partial [Flammeovirgaceae bacterium]
YLRPKVLFVSYLPNVNVLFVELEYIFVVFKLTVNVPDLVKVSVLIYMSGVALIPPVSLCKLLIVGIVPVNVPRTVGPNILYTESGKRRLFTSKIVCASEKKTKVKYLGGLLFAASGVTGIRILN